MLGMGLRRIESDRSDGEDQSRPTKRGRVNLDIASELEPRQTGKRCDRDAPSAIIIAAWQGMRHASGQHFGSSGETLVVTYIMSTITIYFRDTQRRCCPKSMFPRTARDHQWNCRRERLNTSLGTNAPVAAHGNCRLRQNGNKRDCPARLASTLSLLHNLSDPETERNGTRGKPRRCSCGSARFRHVNLRPARRSK